MHILFRNDGCAINGFAHEYRRRNIENLTCSLPEIFYEFIFGEPIKSIGTTFCLWTTENNNWQVGVIEDYEDNSEELLSIFDGNPQTYIDWAKEYFEESYNESGIPIDTVAKIYGGEPLTRKMVLSIVDELKNWERLKEDLKTIGYPYNF